MAPLKRKRRAHFHEFMADVHERIAEHRQKLKNGETQAGRSHPAGRHRARSTRRGLLCFDEFTVTDIADAMILSRLFWELFAQRVRAGRDLECRAVNLYRDGLNRGLFLPFIDLLEQTCR